MNEETPLSGTIIPSEGAISFQNLITSGTVTMSRFPHYSTSCMVCEKAVAEWGDLANPAVTSMGETLCDDCRIKIKKLIGK